MGNAVLSYICFKPNLCFLKIKVLNIYNIYIYYLLLIIYYLYNEYKYADEDAGDDFFQLGLWENGIGICETWCVEQFAKIYFSVKTLL